MSNRQLRFRAAFGQGPVFLPVIHAEDLGVTLLNASIAAKARAHGVFLISHSRPTEVLLELYRAVRRHHPELWIGLNFLREGMLDAVEMLPADADGLWTDASGIADELDPPDLGIRRFRGQWLRRFGGTHKLWFGGFCFKGQVQPKCPLKAAAIAVQYMDVVTTSGEWTGKPPALESVAAIRKMIGDHPFGNASGTNILNVSDLMANGLDAFLVSTSLCKKGVDEFDVDRVGEFAELIRTCGC